MGDNGVEKVCCANSNCLYVAVWTIFLCRNAVWTLRRQGLCWQIQGPRKAYVDLRIRRADIVCRNLSGSGRRVHLLASVCRTRR